MEKVANKVITPLPYGLNYRFERKFVYPDSLPFDIIQKVLMNPFGFREVYHLRKVNNIYFDDAAFNFYKQNVAGVANRRKLRLRWYGFDTNLIENPNLEIKIKQGEVGDKIALKTRGLSYDLAVQDCDFIHADLISYTRNHPAFQLAIEMLHPTLLNTYERRYFLSACGNYRITVDFNQEFHDPNYRGSKIGLRDVILELKYAIENDTEARRITQYFDARLSKNSKYVRGINLLYHPEF